MSKVNQRGKFITIEGQDGAGKSTNLAVIKQLIIDSGHEVIETREPGGTPFGEKVRELLLSSDDQSFGDTAELLMMFAARAQHIQAVIVPALNDGKWVLCDRFTDATYAYQGGGRGIDMQRIAELEDYVQGGLRPDLTFLLDLPVEIGESRAGQRSAPDRFERQKNEFKTKVRACYLERAQHDSERFRLIDASQDLSTVKAAISRAMHDYFARIQSN